MPFIPHTPESKAAKLGRSDSKNPSTTCRGISIASGKPCRRAVGNSPAGTPSKPESDSPPDPNEQYFCWQHKDQAKDWIALKHTPSQKIRRLQGRTSLDTLVEIVIGDTAGTAASEDEEVVGLVNKSTLWQAGPMLVKKNSIRVVQKEGADIRPMTMPVSVSAYGPIPGLRPAGFQHSSNPSHDSAASSAFEKPIQIRHETKPSCFKRIFCCMKPKVYYTDHHPDSDDYPVPARPVSASQSNRPMQHVKFDTVPQAPPPPRMQVMQAKPAIASLDDDSDSDVESSGSSSYESTNSADKKKIPDTVVTPELPVSLSRRTRNALLDEAHKPVSQKDEDGYIYVFWLRDGTGAPPNSVSNSAANVTSSPPARLPLKGGPTTEARLNAAMLAGETGSAEKRLLLKIGRANNVQRRLHEWSAQCGYNLSLIRYYPHVSVTAEESDSESDGSESMPLMVPFSHRVERLIHMELKDANFNRPHRCSTCERLHREWFSVPATKEGLAHVDETIKRWVKWANDTQKAISETGADSNPASQSSEKTPSPSPRRKPVPAPSSSSNEKRPAYYSSGSSSTSSGSKAHAGDSLLNARMQNMTVNGDRPRQYY